MKSLISRISDLLPASWNIPEIIIFIAVLLIGLLLLGLLIRAILGKQSDWNHALSVSLAILFSYVLCALVYKFFPDAVGRFLAPLPYVSFQSDLLVLMPLRGIAFPTLCRETLSMVMLAFLVNLVDSWVPKGEKVLNWFFYRLCSVFLSVGLHYLIMWVFNRLLPGSLAANAPTILLGILIGLMLLGVLKVLLGLLLTIANPILGAIYAFFFSNKIGKQLSKAVLTTVVLAVIILILEYFGYTSISITGSAFGGYAPVGLVLLILWYLIGHIL